MSDKPTENVVPVTEAPSDAPAAEGEKGPSKGALKKAAKEKEKARRARTALKHASRLAFLYRGEDPLTDYVQAEKAAKRKAEEDAQKKAADANDISKEDYGEIPMLGSQPYVAPKEKVPRVNLAEIAEQYKDTSSMDEAGGPQIVFRGIVENARAQSAKLGFITFRQELDTIQAVVAESETLSRQFVKFAGKIPAESVVLVHGLVKKPKELIKSTTIQHLELHVKKLYVVAKADSQLPMQVTDAERPIPVEGEDEKTEDDGRPIVGLNTRLNNRVIDLRGKHNTAIFTIKDGVINLFQEFLRARKFIGVNSPRLLGSASEGGANVFEVKYFNTKAFLAQSPQLYKQMLVASRFERVMEVGPIFRAENSNTARHLTEFTGLDMEMAFEEDYHEVVGMLEELMLYIFNGLRTRYGRETDLVRSIYSVEEFKLPEAGKVPRLPFSEGIQMLRDDGLEIGDFDDLSTPDEKRLGALVLKKYGTDFYVLDKYPLNIRPFYTMPSAETQAAYDPANPNAGTSNSYDFFMRGQEIMSGAQRIHDATFLEKRMRECPTPVDPKSEGLRDYVNAFRYGCPPHAGGGIGLERIVMLWLGLPNVRLASLFPRDPNRLSP